MTPLRIWPFARWAVREHWVNTHATPELLLLLFASLTLKGSGDWAEAQGILLFWTLLGAHLTTFQLARHWNDLRAVPWLLALGRRLSDGALWLAGTLGGFGLGLALLGMALTQAPDGPFPPLLPLHLLAQAGLAAGLALIGWRLMASPVPGLALALVGFVVAASGVPLVQYLLPTGPALPLTFRLLGLVPVLGALAALAPHGDRLTYTE